MMLLRKTNEDPFDDSVSLKKETIVLNNGLIVEAELWSECEMTFLTYHVPGDEIREDITGEKMAEYLRNQGINIHCEDFDGSSLLKERNTPPLWNFTLHLT